MARKRGGFRTRGERKKKWKFGINVMKIRNIKQKQGQTEISRGK